MLRTPKRRAAMVAAGLALAVALSVAAAGPCEEQQKLLASDGARLDNFGYSVSISGDTVLVGAAMADNAGWAESGAAYVYTRSGSLWTQQQKLVASDVAVSHLFGFSVSLFGDTAVVGGAGDDTASGLATGSAYVYVRSGAAWAEQQRLTASDAETRALFGYSVSVSGDTVVAGALVDDNAGGVDAGSAYVYVRSGSLWTEQQKLVASDGATSDYFGYSVSVSGDTAVVGSEQGVNFSMGTDAGAAYVFERTGGIWTQQQKLVAADWALADSFGCAVAVSSDTVVVGAWLDDNARGTDAGAAYVYVRSGSVWTEQQKLVASDGQARDAFGYSVTIFDDTIVVGARDDDDEGSAYVFVRSGSVWREQQRLLASDRTTSGDAFGYSVSVSGDTAVVAERSDDRPFGTDAGSAFVYVPCAGACPPLACDAVTATPASACEGEEQELFVATSGGTGSVIVTWDLDGDTVADIAGNPALVTLAGGSWTITATATDSCVPPQRCTSDPVVATVDLPPLFAVLGARDPDACNLGLELIWDAATFRDPSGSGTYDIYRSETDCLDATSRPPVATGVSGLRHVDVNTRAGQSYFYVVQAEDARLMTPCPRGPHHGGAVNAGLVCVGPVLESPDAYTPDLLGWALRAGHVGDDVTMAWPGSRALLPGEHFHVLKSYDEVGFARVNLEGDRSTTWIETDTSRPLQFFDVRIATPCEIQSLDDEPPG